MSKQPWELRFDYLVKMYELCINGRDRWDLKGLYIELGHEGKRLIAAGEMPEGAKYKIPFENDWGLILGFYADSTTLDAVSDTGEVMSLMTREASVRKEYRLLETYTFGAKEFEGGVFRYGIGEKYPESFERMFTDELKPGHIIIFDTPRGCVSFLCTETHDYGRTLKRLYSGDIRKATIAKFAEADEKVYYFADDGLQRLYREVKWATGSTHVHVVSLYDREQEEIINKLHHTLNGSRSAVLEIGNERISIQKKGVVKKEFRWSDRNGNRISKEQAKMYTAWVLSTPMQLNIKYKAKTGEEELELFIKECGIRSGYENLIARGNYLEAADYLAKQAVKHGKEFAISLDSFDSSGISVSFLFKPEKDGRCHMFRSGKDYRDKAKNTRKTNPDELAAFLTERYTDFHMYEYDRRSKFMYERYPDADEYSRKPSVDATGKDAKKED